MDAYNAAEKAGASALGHALECGKHLRDAHKTVGKGKWKKWRDNNLPTVSEETERVYRRLAEAVAKKEDVFAGCISIREALKHLSGLDENLNPKPQRTRTPRTTQTGSTAAALEPAEADKPSGLETELENAAADEIISNIHDADKLDEVATASVARMTPDKVCGALTKAWSPDQLRDLIKRVNDYLITLASAARPSQGEPAFRRPPPQQPAH
jgi:hypothetical protein